MDVLRPAVMISPAPRPRTARPGGEPHRTEALRVDFHRADPQCGDAHRADTHRADTHRDRSPETELARLQEQVAWLRAERAALWWAVGHDELTGLANRRLFGTLAPSLVHGSRPAVVIIVDLNGFKPINDTLGHEAGDRVLRTVADRLARCAGD